MKPIRIYLGGMIRPAAIIDGQPRGIFEPDLIWRRDLKELAETEEGSWFIPIDPIDGFPDIWGYDDIEIVRICLAKLRSCHVMIANLSVCGSDMNRSIGTIIESWEAAQHDGIPVVTIADDPYFYNNCWVRFASTQILHTPNEALTYIQGSLLW